MTWALPEHSKDCESFTERLIVHLTGSANFVAATDSAASGFDAAEEEGTTEFGEPEDGIELEQQKGLLSNESDEYSRVGSDALSIKLGRPNLADIIDQTFAHGAVEKVAVIVCGPRQLGQYLRKEIGRYASRGRDVWFWDESFAL